MKVNTLLVTGVSGTGKSTVLKQLQKRGINAIGIDETEGLSYWINRETGKKVDRKVEFTQKFLDAYDWVCDIDMLRNIISQSDKSVVVCGSSDNILECMELFETTILLECPPEVFLERIQSRIGNDYGKDEDSMKMLLGYYQQYNQQCIDSGAIVIDAARSIDLVVDEVLSCLE